MSETFLKDTPLITRDIHAAIKNGLVGANDKVKAAIIAVMLKEELDKRTKAATSVFEKIEQTELELRKIKPTYAGHKLDGTPIGEPSYTKEQVEAAKKANEQLTKLNNALTKALTEDDFSKVLELAGK